MAKIVLSRPPQTTEELYWAIRAFFGVTIPNRKVCPEHVSPMEAIAHAFFSKPPNYAVWYASRGSGKSEALAILGLMKSFIWDVDVTILGGSMTQSKNVAEHMSKLMAKDNAPTYAMEKRTATELRLHTQKTIRPLPASQTTVRGPHPPLQLLDEVDEMEMAIYDASMGQAMPQENHWGETVHEYIVASSTWQNPVGTFTQVIEKARKEGQPIFSWCWRELVKDGSTAELPPNPSGWMTMRQVEAKRRTVSQRMWETEYELNEPSGASRAFDLDALERCYVEYPEPIARVDKGDAEQSWTWEEREPAGQYVVGADWAKEVDFTVITVLRIDRKPYRLVKYIRVHRKPYPVMIGMFNREIESYAALGATHDKTGLGNVVHDFLNFSDTTEGFTMVGQARTQMLNSYITAVEHGDYALPRGVYTRGGEQLKDERLAKHREAHRGATVADVYGSAKWDGHLPDEVASMALAHRAADLLQLPTTESSGVPKAPDPRKVDAGFHANTLESPREMGGVTIVDETEMGMSLLVGDVGNGDSWSPHL